MLFLHSFLVAKYESYVIRLLFLMYFFRSFLLFCIRSRVLSVIQGVFGLILSLFLEVRDDVFSFTILTMVSCRELKVSSLLLGSENQGSQLNLLRDSFIASMLGSLDVELLNFFLGKGGFFSRI